MKVTKRCVSCRRNKALTLFGRNASTSDKLHIQCKNCVVKYHRAKKYWTRYRRIRLPGIHRISHDCFASMLSEIENRCELCGNSFKNDKDKQIDHDHITGYFRGVICVSCNLLLGRIGDTPASVTKWAKHAHTYMKRATKRFDAKFRAKVRQYQ